MEDNNMKELLQKAEVLIEALPYIQRFNRKIIVVKYGGSAMVDEELKKHVIQDVTLLKLVGFKPIIVHGGGKEISKWVGKVGMEPVFINGLRKTDEATMEIAEMVLNKVNKSLVTLVQELGVNAVGISGKDGGLLKVEKKYSNGEDIGFVGEITEVNPQILYDLLEKDFLPIICPVGMDAEYNSYNINADDAACAIAKAVKAEKLAFLTDIEGVYKDPKVAVVHQKAGGEQAHRDRGERTDRGRIYRRRHASEVKQLYRCDRERCFKSTYLRRTYRTLPAS
jgi:acetylglutamate kinase